jgi:O-glycosyl hydrolase
MAPDFRREEANRHLSLAANRTALYQGRRIAHGPETSSRPVWFPSRQLRAAAAMRCVPVLAVCAVFAALSGNVHAQDATQITVQTARVRQVFEGLGAGAIFYEGHITSLAARDKNEQQQQLYDDMFSRVPTRYLQLMIRETHEPQNDNTDPFTPAFDEKNFEYCKHTVQIAKAALKRRPDMQLYATLYTPPPWMKTNNAASGGGEDRATLKDKLELELGEYVWAFLAHMQKNGVPIQYLSIANEPDWPHTQPGYFLTPERHAALFRAVGEYLDKMAKKYPEVPRPKLVGPNTLSAPGAAKDYLPRILKSADKYLDVIGSHDYDPRGDRWGELRKLAGRRPVWATEWCARAKDASPGMIRSATEYGVAMHEAFQGGANVFMAYDWVYPPRDSGEALIHVNWGNDYTLTKPYYLFRQWAEPLKPGMRVVEVGVTGRAAAGVKPTAFLALDGRTLVVHVVNAQEKDAPVALKLTGKMAAATAAARSRTSAKEDALALLALKGAGGSFTDTLPARSMVTYLFEGPGK